MKSSDYLRAYAKATNVRVEANPQQAVGGIGGVR